jgi:hypothetical protein
MDGQDEQDERRKDFKFQIWNLKFLILILSILSVPVDSLPRAPNPSRHIR